MSLPRPPSADPLVALADQCVQCGLCLPACPTYRRDRIEAESPRGRIALARGWALEALEPTPTGDRHLDQCLGCRNCEAVCPAGVQFGALLDDARRRQRARRGAAVRQRALEWLVARPRLLHALMSAYRRVWTVLPDGLRPLPRPAAAQARLPRHATGTRPTAALFAGCVAPAYEASTHAALATLLDACGIDLRLPGGQSCCGAVHRHAGNAALSQALAARNRSAFGDAKLVLTLASGCHEGVAAGLAPTPVSDALDLLASHAAALRFRESGEVVALHLPCTQRNVVGSAASLRRLLDAVPDLRLVVLDAGFGCCGAAGTAMFTDLARADAFRRPLLEQLAASGATRVLSANIGCRLHLANGATVPVQHPIDFLAGQLDTSG